MQDFFNVVNFFNEYSRGNIYFKEENNEIKIIETRNSGIIKFLSGQHSIDAVKKIESIVANFNENNLLDEEIKLFSDFKNNRKTTIQGIEKCCSHCKKLDKLEIVLKLESIISKIKSLDNNEFSEEIINSSDIEENTEQPFKEFCGSILNEKDLVVDQMDELIKQDPSYIKKGFYNISFFFNLACYAMGKYEWWNPIIEHENGAKLYLGALPVHGSLPRNTLEKNDLKEIKNLGVQVVISMVEEFEMTCTGVFISPITVEQWANEGITHVLYETPDFDTIHQEILKKAAQSIDEAMKQGKKVYIHCKAGRGRSALVVACWLVMQGYTATEALEHIKKHRHQINLDEKKLKSLMQFEEDFKSNQKKKE